MLQTGWMVPGASTTGGEARRRDAGDKGPAWSTALFYLAEHVREATNGAVNHKVLYALICPDRHYINHNNPMVRKRAAGTLSRIIHTKRYVAEMRNAYSCDDAVFDQAAARVCEAVRAARGCDDGRLARWLVGECWPDVRAGLANEAREWRRGLDLFRLDCEMGLLFAPLSQANVVSRDVEWALSSMLYVMVFDCLDVERARALVDARSAGELAPSSALKEEAPADQGAPALEGASAPDAPRASGAACIPGQTESSPNLDEAAALDPKRACMVRFSDPGRTELSGFWAVASDAPFSIGRYTDCDAIELSPEVSRIHCRVLWDDGAWWLEDAGSRNGSVVRHVGTRERASCGDGGQRLRLAFGDAIELPSGSTYLFVSMDERGQFAYPALNCR